MSYNILLADAVLVSRKLIKSVLKSSIENVCFHDAENGQQVLDFISMGNIDLIILDLLLPGKDGFEILKQIKSNEIYGEIPIIVNSSIDGMENIQKTLELGAIDYFIKPLSLEDMKIMLPLKSRNALRYYEQRKLLLQMNRQMKKELNIANIFQLSLMPESKKFEGAEMSGRYKPCEGVGGDLYDCTQIGNSLWFITADITGHGVAAAMASGMVKVVFNYCIQRFTSPEEVLSSINNTFCKMFDKGSSIIFSCVVGLIKDGMLHYSNGGHPYPVIIDNKTNEALLLEQNGLLLGMFEDVEYSVNSLEINRGDWIITYTDGLYDKDSRNNLLNCDIVYDIIQKKCSEKENNPQSFMDSVIEDFSHLRSHSFEDDVTMMVIDIK